MSVYYSVSEAARLAMVSSQAVFWAIYNQRLYAEKIMGKWSIADKDLMNYIAKKYSREFSRHEGELVFDKEKGEYSIADASKRLNMSYGQVYYALRKGALFGIQKKSAWVVQERDLEHFEQSHYMRQLQK